MSIDGPNDTIYQMAVAIKLTSDRVLVALNDLIEIVGLNKIRLAMFLELYKKDELGPIEYQDRQVAYGRLSRLVDQHLLPPAAAAP